MGGFKSVHFSHLSVEIGAVGVAACADSCMSVYQPVSGVEGSWRHVSSVKWLVECVFGGLSGPHGPYLHNTCSHAWRSKMVAGIGPDCADSCVPAYGPVRGLEGSWRQAAQRNDW